jgi:hypothetical protein
MKKLILIAASVFKITVNAQSIYINHQNTLGSVPALYKPGMNITIKTNLSASDYVNNNLTYNSSRIFNIEAVLNWSGVNSISGVMAKLEASKPDVMFIKQRSDILIIPILKMPAWLSSSTNTTPFPPAVDANWTVLHPLITTLGLY